MKKYWKRLLYLEAIIFSVGSNDYINKNLFHLKQIPFSFRRKLCDLIDPMLIETNVCYNGSNRYLFVRKLCSRLEAMLIRTNIICYAGNKILEVVNFSMEAILLPN